LPRRTGGSSAASRPRPCNVMSHRRPFALVLVALALCVFRLRRLAKQRPQL
jgi:hypothetical protein